MIMIKFHDNFDQDCDHHQDQNQQHLFIVKFVEKIINTQHHLNHDQNQNDHYFNHDQTNNYHETTITCSSQSSLKRLSTLLSKLLSKLLSTLLSKSNFNQDQPVPRKVR